MMGRLVAFAMAAATLTMAAAPSLAAKEELPSFTQRIAAVDLPAQLSERDRQEYRALFAAMDGEQWDLAKSLIGSAHNDLLRPFATAELYLAAHSPRVERDDLMALLTVAPDLPQAQQLGRLAQKRGAQSLPPLPQARNLRWMGSTPRREGLDSTATTPEELMLLDAVQGAIKAGDPRTAEQLLNGNQAPITSDFRTELQQRIAWSYYIENYDADARRLAHQAERGTGAWVVQADWVTGLSAWHAQDCRTAQGSFDRVSRNATDPALRAAGLYWGSRADMVCGQPYRVEGKLRSAADLDQTFYGILAARTLGMAMEGDASLPPLKTEWGALKEQHNVRIAMALAEIGQDRRADETLRYQAQIGDPSQHHALIDLARKLDLPTAQIWLAHNGPSGTRIDRFARYPAPRWEPENGWRVDPALVFAHTLQESNFRRTAISAAGARGLMQVRPGTAGDMARKTGVGAGAPDLFDPATNMEYGQSYLEHLGAMGETGGLLPKVIAAYNAGPVPVGRWNSEVRDGGDPLLFIESIPYGETRQYVSVVLRNYWIYQRQTGEKSYGLTAMAQGMWPRFPRLGTSSSQMAAVRISPPSKVVAFNGD